MNSKFQPCRLSQLKYDPIVSFGVMHFCVNKIHKNDINDGLNKLDIGFCITQIKNIPSDKRWYVIELCQLNETSFEQLKEVIIKYAPFVYIKLPF